MFVNIIEFPSSFVEGIKYLTGPVLYDALFEIRLIGMFLWLGSFSYKTIIQCDKKSAKLYSKFVTFSFNENRSCIYNVGPHCLKH